MSSAQWRPVDAGDSVRCNCGAGACSARFVPDGDVVHIHNVSRQAQQYNLYLPENVRLCERVPDVPITPERLRAEGWRDAEKNECVLVKRIDAELTCYFWTDKEGKEHFEVYYAAVPYPGCKSMAQLAALVDMLTGAE